MIETIPIQTIWTALRWIPGFLLRQRFTRDKMARLVYFDLRPRNDSATIDLGPTPAYQIWLQVINLSPFEIELDRASFQFLCGGSPLSASILERKLIAPGEITSILVRDVMPDGYASQIATNIARNPDLGTGYFALTGNIEFNCKVTPFSKKVGHLDGIRPRVINERFRSITLGDNAAEYVATRS